MVDEPFAFGREAISNESKRAYERFGAILKVHGAAIHIFETLPSFPNGREAIVTGIRVNRGMDPDYTHDRVDRFVEELLDAVQDERNAGYATILSSALIAACGAFEYLVKATFVNQALSEPTKAAALLAKKRIRLLASEVLSCQETEQWFLVADRLLDQLAEDERQMHKRVKLFLLAYTLLPLRAEQEIEIEIEIEKAFAELDIAKFNEAFLVRNSLVHNGGCVSAALSQSSGRRIGEPIVLDHKSVRMLIQQLQTLADALHSLWMTTHLGF